MSVIQEKKQGPLRKLGRISLPDEGHARFNRYPGKDKRPAAEARKNSPTPCGRGLGGGGPEANPGTEMKDMNQNKPGYKKTAAGWIPEEWHCAPAGSLFDIQLGKMLNKQARNGHNPLPYLANYNVRWGGFDLAEVQQMDFYEKEMAKFQLQQGDLLVCEGGEVGRCAVWEDQIKPCYFQKALHRVRPSDADIDVYFVMYFLHHAVSSPMMVFYVGQSSISHFTREQFVKFPVALPPLWEQKKIAEIVSTWDCAINQTRNLIAVKKKHKKALMQQLLNGKKRLGRFGTPWQNFQLNDLAEILFSNVDKKNFSSEIPVRICNYMDIYKNRCLRRSYLYMTGTVNKKEYQKFMLKKHDVVITKDSETIQDIAVPCVVSDEFDDLICGYHLAIVRPKPKLIYGPFLSYALRGENVHRNFMRIANGVTRFGLSLNSVKKVEISIPCLEEQKRITNVLSYADMAIESLESKVIALEQQKRGLMQKLLTGEVRVKI